MLLAYATTLAADAAGSGDIISVFLQYGAIGAICVVLGLYARSQIRREQQRADRMESEVTRLNTLIQEKTLPALLAATQASQGATQVLTQIQAQRDLDDALMRRQILEQRSGGGTTNG